MPDHDVLLEARGINKSFSYVPVLKNVGIKIRKGEVHALMGENGAGKSTLIKILTGVCPKDSGTIELHGTPVEFASRKDSALAGIGVIYQELSLIPTLSVTQNITLAQESTSAGFLKTGEMRKLVRQLLRTYEFVIDPDAIVENLGMAQRQLVEIVKALSRDTSLLVMDEPTASLGASESETLFHAIESLKARGVSILYISHRIEEVCRLADRLTILRDGEVIAVLEKEAIVPTDVIRLMIGRSVAWSSFGRMRLPSGPKVLEVTGLCRRGVFEDVSFAAHSGEVLGIGGLVGSGRSEVIGAIFGATPYDSGEIVFDGHHHSRTVLGNIYRGMGFVPEDRRTQGFIPLLSVKRNIALASFDLLKDGHLLLQERVEETLAKRMIAQLDIKPGRSDVPVMNLSGGNQQKVVLAKWFARSLKLLFVDEPTAGIDVGAKEEIYALLESLAKAGVAVVVVTSDAEEIVRISHRILIFRAGKVFAEFREGTVSQANVLHAVSGMTEKGGPP